MEIKRRHIAIGSIATIVAAALVFALVWVNRSEGPNAVEVDRAEFAAFDERSADESLPGQSKKETEDSADARAEKKPKKKESEGEEAEKPEKAERPEKAEKPEKAPAKKPKPEIKKVNWKPAVLEVVTNFDKADVKVNGIPYPEYTAPGEATGVVLPAGGPYWVEVTADGNTKTYRVYLRANETRLLLVDLTGFNGKRPPPAKPSVPEPKKAEKDDEEEEQGPGKVTVYSKPPGVIMVDGEKKSDKTPGTLEVENGRHEIQVEYDGGGVSEKKIVRVREGSRIKLFFRKRD